MGTRGFLLAAAAALVLAAPAAADDQWWPHASDATWTYQWTDSQYNTTPTKEKVTVASSKKKTFTLAWTTAGQGNPSDAPSSNGTMDFQESNAGLQMVNFSASPPSPDFPVLCPQVQPCDSALTSTLFFTTWGTSSALLEPLLSGTTWDSAGLSQFANPSSTSKYMGVETVKVPAFPDGVPAAKVQTNITQAGALGDPYGSGVRTVWWVYGVGPVKMVFDHAGGSDAAVTESDLLSTNQTPAAAPPDTNYFPLKKGETLTYRWTNRRHLKKPSIQRFTLDKVLSTLPTARFTVRDVSGPIRVAGSYVFSLRLDGLTTVATNTEAASLVKFPRLKKGRHFFTPFDLMVYGFNPVLPAYPAAGNTWGSKNPSRDFSIFGVTGSTRILGVRTVKTPAGKFRALEVRSTLRQAGSKFGSGTRTSWFAPGKGLVKLVFRHGDGSTSVVTLIR